MHELTLTCPVIISPLAHLAAPCIHLDSSVRPFRRLSVWPPIRSRFPPRRQRDFQVRRVSVSGRRQRIRGRRGIRRRRRWRRLQPTSAVVWGIWVPRRTRRRRILLRPSWRRRRWWWRLLRRWILRLQARLLLLRRRLLRPAAALPRSVQVNTLRILVLHYYYFFVQGCWSRVRVRGGAVLRYGKSADQQQVQV